MIKTLIFSIIIFGSTASSFSWPGIYVPKDNEVLSQYGKSESKFLDKDEIDVFVWNIYKADYYQWEEQYNSQLPNFDLFLIQEVLTKPEVVDIFEGKHGIQYTSATSFKYKKTGFSTGIATGSRSLAHWKKFLRSSKLEPIIGTPKLTLFTKYSLKGSNKDLLVVNIHAINFVTSFALHSQLKDAAKIIKKHDGPVIFAGDFNTWTYEKQSFLRELTQKMGFSEVTFKNDTRKKMFGWILDFIFVKDLEILSSKVHDELDGSDHKAISAKLKLKD
ncbi:endonuclease/exonuclease/phosphatase family protein [Halobacteriovorax sp. HLS]|uniref:endonuclease/exonuclease/phosphatase family protein n=1 Tax=Halobacteriovorax sp. HLS TaxID=2234000 RepID=UPI000FD86509|nr:endonuclease/exonuclease/phosphatase family protein [Halobacteriovorax sp. HLS]